MSGKSRRDASEQIAVDPACTWLGGEACGRGDTVSTSGCIGLPGTRGLHSSTLSST
jgi:hypothetical protein